MFRNLLFLAIIAVAGLPKVDAEDDYRRGNGLASSYSPYGQATAGERYQPSRDSRQDSYAVDYVADGDYRQPTSLAMIGFDQALLATKLSGEIYRVDLLNHHTEVVLSAPHRQFGDLTKVDDQRVLATDIGGNELVLLEFNPTAQTLEERASVPIPGRPDSVCLTEDATQLWVSSVWGQRLHRVELTGVNHSELRVTGSIDLPMCGGEVLWIGHRKTLVVFDAFGTHYCVVDPQSQQIVHHGQLHEHNLVDVQLIDDGQRVMFPQQLLIDLVSAVQGQITWGNVLSNNLRVIESNRLVDSRDEEVYRQSQFIPIGSVGNGAGDPTSIAIHGDQLAVTIGGTNQVAIGKRHSTDFKFIGVGYRPIDCEFTEDGKRLLVVNQFSDSLSVIDVQSKEVRDVKLGELRPPSDAEHGEQLFHDSRLSHDGWMSCQSCHAEGHTNGLLSDNFTDGTYESPKRVLSLLGQAETMPYSWTGSVPTLEEQVTFSIQSTMAGDEAARPLDVDHIAKYLRTLPRPPSVLVARNGGELDAAIAEQVERGANFFRSAGCVQCHQGPHFTSSDNYDVEIHDEQGTREFNPPSLLGVSQRQNSLFHDGRAKSINDVIHKENHQMPTDATDQERRDLEVYLLSL